MRTCPNCSNSYGNEVKICPNDAYSFEDEKQEIVPGQLFAGQYEIISTLGRGGMSVVYKARHRLMDRMVAIKLLQAENDPIAVERFKHEAKSSSTLKHPNIISIYDFGIVGKQSYIVMDCLEGPTLGDVIEKRGPMDPARAVNIFRRACMGLQHAHKHKIVHRDIKPSNLCLVRDDNGRDNVVIVDFGIAKMMQEGHRSLSLTQTGEVFGSPLYMSPEQCMGRPLDVRSDIYSFGCVMYETLTGRPPITGENAYDTMNLHCSKTPAPFKTVNPDLKIDPSIEALVFRCLEKEPDNRYQSITEVLADMPVHQPDSGSLQVKAVQHPSRQRRETKILRFSFWGMFLFIFSVFLYMSLDNGPDGDHGTVLEKTIWNSQTTMAQTFMNFHWYDQAMWVLNIAEHTARTKFNNLGRTLTALNMKRAVCRKGRMYEELARVDAAIKETNKKYLVASYKKQLAELDELDPKGDRTASSVNRVLAPFTLDDLQRIVVLLDGAGMDKESEALLVKARRIYLGLLGKDDRQIADIDILLAECYLKEQQLPKVRALLTEALAILRKENPPDKLLIAAVLMHLGQIDRDENRYEYAKLEFEEAMHEAENSKGADRYLLFQCMNSYASYLDQIGKKEESQALFKKAEQLFPHDNLDGI